MTEFSTVTASNAVIFAGWSKADAISIWSVTSWNWYFQFRSRAMWKPRHLTGWDSSTKGMTSPCAVPEVLGGIFGV